MRATTFSLAVLATGLLLPSAALGQEPSRSQPPHATDYVTRVQNGIRLAVARDTEGALAALREAVALEGGRPEAFLHMGITQRMAGNLADAVEACRTAARVAGMGNDAILQGRALSCVAATLERQDGQLTAAREAWDEVARFAGTQGDNALRDVARARIQAIDTAAQQEAAYVEVRQRIAERERQARPAASH